MMIVKKHIKAGVIGDPINHSLSPKIHQYWLNKYQIDGSYVPIKIAKGDLVRSLDLLIKDGFAGFNVTIPHKEEMYKLCDQLSNSARITKAVNTVIFLDDKINGCKIFGHNSDVDGFLTNLNQSCPDFDLQKKTAFVIGSGGAARAVVYGLIKSKVKNIFITNRNLDRAQNLIDDFSRFDCSFNVLDQEAFNQQLSKCDLLVNTTCLGMVNCDKLEISLNKLPKSAIIYDIVYNPLITDLLKAGQTNGNKIVTGIGMLINQASVGFEMWFKNKVDIDDRLVQILTNHEQKYQPR